MTPPAPDGPPIAARTAERSARSVRGVSHVRGGRERWTVNLIRGVALELRGFATAMGLSFSALAEGAMLRELERLRGTPDLLDKMIADQEAASPGFAASVQAAYERRQANPQEARPRRERKP